MSKKTGSIATDLRANQLQVELDKVRAENVRLKARHADPTAVEVDDLSKKIRALEHRNTLFEIIGDKVMRAVANIPPLPPVSPPRARATDKTKSEEEAVLLISDVQAGSKIDLRDAGGLGAFNSEILAQQIDYVRDTVISVLTRYHPHVRRLHVWFLGDIVDGETIFGGQLREIDMNVIQQVIFCWEKFNAMLLAFAASFERIECSGVIGNHGRVGKKGEHAPMSNFDYLVYRMLQERTARVKNITWSVPESWYDVREVLGWKWLLVHGDDAGQGFAGIPFYAFTRHKSRYREMFNQLRREHGDFDYMAAGHISQISTFQDIWINGSWPGGTEFSIKRLQLADQPAQWLIGVNRTYGATWGRKLQLRPARGRRKPA